MPCLTARSPDAFKHTYGYEFIKSGAKDEKEIKKQKAENKNNHTKNLVTFLTLIPVIGLIANLILLAKMGAFSVGCKQFHAMLLHDEGGKCILSILIVSGIGLGILLLLPQIIATFMNLNDRCVEIDKEKKKGCSYTSSSCGS
jgi:hypothetical protein